MSIDFPVSPPDKTFYPDPENIQPGDLQYIYDEPSNSWNLVAPDNLATIDYVDGLLGDDARNIRRNYDLHQSTNSITARLTQNYAGDSSIQNCNDLAVSSFNTELTTVGSNDLPSGQLNDINEVISTGYTIEEWFACVSEKTSSGDFCFLGVSIGTFTNSSNLKDGVAVFFNKEYNGGSDTLTGDNFAVGSILEIKRDTSNSNPETGFKDDAYGVYRIIRVEEVLVPDSTTVSGYGIGVEFLYTHNISGDIDYLVKNNPASFVVFAKSLDRDGGIINGPLNIVYDSENTLTVSKTEDVSTMVLRVDTTNNRVTTNDTYNEFINSEGDQASILNGLATVDYVNTRMGIGSFNNSNLNGPYLRLAGGTVSGKVIFDQVTAVDDVEGFTIVARPKNIRESILYLKTAGDGDRIEYAGNGDNDLEIQNKKQIESKINSTVNGYVKKSGDTLNNNSRISLSNSDSNTSFTDRNLVTWGKVKDITVAMVRDGSPQNPGELYEKNGSLYYRGYT